MTFLQFPPCKECGGRHGPLPLGLKFFHKQETFRCSNDQRASGGLFDPSGLAVAGYCAHLGYLYPLTPEAAYRGWPGIHTPDKKSEFFRASPPVDLSVLFPEGRRKTGISSLRDRLDTS